MRKALITGVTGFVGGYLAEELLKNNEFEVAGTYHSEKSLGKLEEIRDKIKLFQLDLNNYQETEKIITKYKPDVIFHLAAQSSPKLSFDNPGDILTNNILCELNILEVLRKNEMTQVKILTVSSADIYGLVKAEDVPIDELTPLNPTNPYAVSKIATDYLALQYFLTYKIQVVRVRPFNHVGPKQSTDFVIPSFCKKIADIEKGNQNKLIVGNLDSKREFTDVRDIVKAYVLAIEKGVAGEVYNIGNGNSYKISEILNILIGLSKIKVDVEVDSNLLRPLDNPDLACDPSKFEKLTGWKPQIPLEKTLQDTLDYWRNIN